MFLHFWMLKLLQLPRYPTIPCPGLELQVPEYKREHVHKSPLPDFFLGG